MSKLQNNLSCYWNVHRTVNVCIVVSFFKNIRQNYRMSFGMLHLVKHLTIMYSMSIWMTPRACSYKSTVTHLKRN